MPISKLKNHPLMSAIAVACSLLLVTGQALACCHINESMVNGLEHWLSESSTRDAENHGHAANTDSDTHCHEEVQKSCEGVSFTPQDHCISGSSLSAKSMVASESHSLLHFPVVVFSAVKPVLRVSFQFEVPRPQNKSSPPVYLTTRHLVV